MMEDFILPFLSVALAELGDKTQLAIFCMASETKEHGKLLFGVMLAFLLSTTLAVVFGNIIAASVPLELIHLAAGVLFILLGMLTLLGSKKEECKSMVKDPLISGFILTFLAELGDKTQITAALFSTRFNPFLVFAGALVALFLLSASAIYVGKKLAVKINRKLLSYAAGLLFILIGLGFVLL